jgi:hypothetical protein
MVKAKKTTGKKENPVDKLTALLNEDIAPKLDTPCTERRAFPEIPKGLCQTEASRTRPER